MKYLSLSLFCLLIFGCKITEEYDKAIRYTKEVYAKSYLCETITARWKKDNSLLDGVYKFKGKYPMIAHYSKGIRKKLFVYKGGRMVEKKMYSITGTYSTTLYCDHELNLLYYDTKYDSITYKFKDHLLKSVSYFNKGEELVTTVCFKADSILVKSITDEFNFTDLELSSFNIECTSLLRDPETGKFYNEIVLEIEKPSSKWNYYFKLTKKEYFKRYELYHMD